MKLPIYQADAFTDHVFGGNPAAVCPLEEWLSDEVMQHIAAENNLSETSFFVKDGDAFHLRWFTPATEVKLCGHATLATAHIMFTELGYDREEIHFNTKSGVLIISRTESGYKMDFPAEVMPQVQEPPQLFEALGIARTPYTYQSDDVMVVLGSEKEVADLNPNFNLLKEVDARGIIVTAPGDEVDFVSRFFAPAVGIDEDPVTGSAHTKLAPLWAKTLGKNELVARQISKRVGDLQLILKGDRVEIYGEAQTYLKGEIYL